MHVNKFRYSRRGVWIGFLLFISLLIFPVVASDEAYWQETIDARGVWYGLPNGIVWGFIRFYSYGNDQWETRIYRQSNTSDQLKFKFNSGMMSFWERSTSQWLTIGSYPSNEWLELHYFSDVHFGFELRYAINDVEFLNDLDNFYAIYYGVSDAVSPMRQSLDRYGNRLSDIFNFQINFYGGSIAFDYVDCGSAQELFLWPQDRWVIEEFEDNDFSNWENASITCNETYTIVSNMTIGKYWIMGSEPSNPQWADVEKPWWENIQDQTFHTFARGWERMRQQFLEIPIFGEFLTQLWEFFNWIGMMLYDVWGILVANIPAIAMLVLMGYFFGMMFAIVRGDVEGIKDAFIKPLEMAWNLMGTIVNIIQTIWNFIKIW